MESNSNSGDKLKNYYHKMADLHVKNKNYKSAYVYYVEAAEKYYEATKLALRDELVENLKDKCDQVLKKGEVCKKRFNETKISTHSELNKSKKVKKFKDLSLKEQKYVFDNINIYKEIANAYTDAYAKVKDNQYLHAIFEANKQAAFAYIIGSQY
jgi:RNase P subunit RPR2